MNLRKLSDIELLNTAKTLVGKEREVLINLLWYLVEIEQRELHLKQGYSSMYKFLMGKLKYSEAQALRRLRAARCIRDLPEIEGLLLAGKLNLCTIALAHNELRSDKKHEVLEQISGASKKEAEMILAKDKPNKKVKDSIKPIGKKLESASTELPLITQESTVPGNGKTSNDIKKVEKEPVKLRHHVKFSASEEFVEKLDEVKSLLSTKYPAGISLEEVFSECMEEYLDKHSPVRKQARRAKRKLKAVKANKHTRHIPAKIRDQVFIRDNHQCTYTSTDGTRCCSKHNLHVDHIKPFALGGSNEPENLRLLCAKHNRLEAKRVFGNDLIKRCIEKST